LHFQCNIVKVSCICENMCSMYLLVVLGLNLSWNIWCCNRGCSLSSSVHIHKYHFT
jgi:hypothetical protein